MQIDPISAEDLRQRLDSAGYDIPQLERLGRALNVDLLAILAGWAHITAEMLIPPAEEVKPSIWRRIWRYLNGDV